jgi:hypothetical protein
MFRNLKTKFAKIALAVLALQLAFVGVGAGATQAVAIESPIAVTAENFNTHKAADYNGVSVGYKLEGVDVAKVTSVNVSLFDALGNKMVENISKSADKVNTAKQYSSAFIVIPGTYTTSSTWDFGTWSPAATTTVDPAKAVITVTDINGFVYTAENTLFQASAPSHPTWASLFNDIMAIDVISGTLKVGEILTAGAVTPIAATVVYQWQSSLDGLNYLDIVGANAKQFALTSDEVGKLIRVIASGTVLYTGTVKSVPTTAVQAIAVAPAAVTGLTTIVNGAGHVTLSWTNPPTGTFTGIRVYRVGDFYVDLDPTATTFTDLTVQKGVTYQYVVMVIGENGITTSSPQVTVAVPAPVVAAAVSDTTAYVPIDLDFDADSNVAAEVKADTTEADKVDEETKKEEDNDFPAWGILLLVILAAVGGYLIWSQKPETNIAPTKTQKK